MHNNKRASSGQRNVSDKELLHAMRRAQWLVPETVEEVAKAEAEVEKTVTDRPTSFNDPLMLLTQGIRLNYVNSISPAEDEEVTEGLGRAAREGRVISPEVEERMKRDRDTAESK
jgi:hypothetical protein